MTEKIHDGGPVIENPPTSLSDLCFAGPEIRNARTVANAEPHALPRIDGGLVNLYHIGALRELAAGYATARGVSKDQRGALGCPSANIRLVA